MSTTMIAPSEVVRTPKALYEVLPNGRWKFNIDHTTLQSFTTCERLFKFKHLNNARRRGGFAFNTAVGIWWSEVMSEFYESIHDNGKVTLGEAVQSAVKYWLRYDMERFKTIALEKYQKFGGSEIRVGLRLNGSLRAGADAERYVNLPTGAIAMVSEYWTQRAEADARDWKILATESHFGITDDLILAENEYVIVNWTGRIDLAILDHQGRLIPVDFKTRDYVDPAAILLDYKPHPQTAGYIVAMNHLAGQLGVPRNVDRCMLIVCGRLTPAEPRKKGNPKKPRFAQVYVPYSQSELAEWQEQTLRKVSRMREALETNFFITKEVSCHNQFGSPCEFREVCNKPPEVRDAVLRRDYEVILPWSPARPDDRNVGKGEKS